MIIPTEAEILQRDSNDIRDHNNDSSNSLLTRSINYYHNNARINKQHQHYQSSSTGTGTISFQTTLPFVGLVYVQETLPNKNEPNKKNEILVGTVFFTETRPNNALQMRQMIVQQSVFKMDNHYTFLTSFGTPITISQEASIDLKYLINTQNTIKFSKDYSTIRCSIIGQYLNGHDQLIGYVLASYDLNLKILRDRVNELIREGSFTFNKYSTNYSFVHSFHYTIGRHNESDIILIDIIHNNAIFIKFEIPLENYMVGSNMVLHDQPRTTNFKYSSNDDLVGNLIEDRTDVGSNKQKSTSIQKRITVTRRKTVKMHKPSVKFSQRKHDVMISYARQEAAEKALLLKDTLIKRGYMVYLDVHEIQMGSDWQDSLNDAVRNCSYFIPLITPMYGKTQWTNREVKLADILRKPIIPINFLDFWPPECLAIQFATTQYISWRPKGPDSNDSKIWDPQSIELVAKLIIEQIKNLSDKKKEKDRDVHAKDDERIDNDEIRFQNRRCINRPLIVISAHPEQYSITMKIKNMLISEYDVWCSNDKVDMDSKEENTKNSIQSEAGQLTPILERVSNYPPLTPEVQDYARRIAESSKQRPKSMPSHEMVTYEVKKNELSRTATYNGVETHSSISPEKFEELIYFQQKLDASSLVIIVASEKYYKSRTSLKHVYYCGQRKKNILVQGDKCQPPVWFTRLISSEFPLNFERPKFKDDLIQKIRTVLDPSCKVMNTMEMKMKCLVENLRKNIFNMETCVYVIGSTNLDIQRNIEICNEIGRELAKVSNLQIITNGFYGTSDVIAHTFLQERIKERKDSNSSVIHILPVKDCNDYTKKARQNHEKLFEKIDYGNTFLMGDSVSERDQVVAYIFDTCILIGGDEDVAHVIEEFIWNDHFVIPVPSTGGAAAGQFDVNNKIFTSPNGVNQSDWEILSQSDATPNEVAKAIVRIVIDLKKALYDHKEGIISKNESNLKKSFNEKPTKKRMANRKRLNININQNVKESVKEDGGELEPNSPEKILPCFSKNESIVEGKNGKGKFRNFFKGIHMFTKL